MSIRLVVDRYTGDDSDKLTATPRAAHWTGGHTVAPPDADQHRALLWARQAVKNSARRTQAAIADAGTCWQAAVEGVWWVSALDDLLTHLVGEGIYVRPQGR